MMEVYLIGIMQYLAAQSWQIAVLIVAVTAATFALRHRSAHVRYLLWLIVLAKCLVPPLHAVPLRVLPPAPERMPPVAPRLVWSPPTAPTAPSVEPLPFGPLTPQPLALPLPTARQPSLPDLPDLHEVTIGMGLAPFGWAVAIIWFAGAGVYLLVNVRRAWWGHCWLRKTRRPLHDEAQAEAASFLRAYGVRRLPSIWLIERVGQPFVWGLLHESIYVPPSFLAIANPDHRRHVLAHELSHVLRFDGAINVAQILTQGLFWFHPFVWWANRQIRREREKCCDEMVLARLHTTPKDYCTAILETLAHATESARPLPSLAIAGPLKSIEGRIRTMLRPGKQFRTRPSVGAAVLVGLIALAIIPATLVPAARAGSAPKGVADNDGSGPLRCAARTFNSTMAFDVFVQETPRVGSFRDPFPGRPVKWVGRTPSAVPLKIPACEIWGVQPVAPAPDWDALVHEIEAGGIPGLQLPAATDSEVRHLAHLTTLQHLSLADSKITDAGLAYLGDMTGLRTLDLSGTWTTAAGLMHLQGLTGLRRLDLSRTVRTGESKPSLVYVMGLEGPLVREDRPDSRAGGPRSDPADTPAAHPIGWQSPHPALDPYLITDTGMQYLKSLVGLRELSLRNTRISNASMEHLKVLTRLQYLDVRGTQITEAGLGQLQRSLPARIRGDRQVLEAPLP
jgi:beta-lactamase regulating signal transducer with metallopeptidase domain